MFLRNYDNYMALLQTTDVGYITANGDVTFASQGSTTVFGDGNLNCKRTDGSVGTVFIHYNKAYTAPYIWTACGLGVTTICLGAGNTPVSYDDYCLSGNIVPNKLVSVSNSLAYDGNTAKYTRKLVCTYTNSTDSNITIAEWGMYRPTNYAAAMPAYGNNANCSLVFREVLSNPIVIAPGTTATLTFEIEVPMANHP